VAPSAATMLSAVRFQASLPAHRHPDRVLDDAFDLVRRRPASTGEAISVQSVGSGCDTSAPC
jgi:hypothetical protein